MLKSSSATDGTAISVINTGVKALKNFTTLPPRDTQYRVDLLRICTLFNIIFSGSLLETQRLHLPEPRLIGHFKSQCRPLEAIQKITINSSRSSSKDGQARTGKTIDPEGKESWIELSYCADLR